MRLEKQPQINLKDPNNLNGGKMHLEKKTIMFLTIMFL